MRVAMQPATLMNSVTLVSRIIKGQAAMIFNEVAKSGVKIVINDNKPACVLLSPEMYEDIMEKLGDMDLIMEVERRLEDDDGVTIPFHEVLAGNGLTEADLADWEDVEIE